MHLQTSVHPHGLPAGLCSHTAIQQWFPPVGVLPCWLGYLLAQVDPRTGARDVGEDVRSLLWKVLISPAFGTQMRSEAQQVHMATAPSDNFNLTYSFQF